MPHDEEMEACSKKIILGHKLQVCEINHDNGQLVLMELVRCDGWFGRGE